jgi:hypothetical protein
MNKEIRDQIHAAQQVLDETHPDMCGTGNRIAALEAELETERMRLAACGVAALCDTPSSMAKQRIEKDNPYWSASYGDVLRQVESLIALRAELAASRSWATIAEFNRLTAGMDLPPLHMAVLQEGYELAIKAAKGES